MKTTGSLFLAVTMGHLKLNYFRILKKPPGASVGSETFELTGWSPKLHLSP